MDPVAEPLSFYGEPSDAELLEWSWVDAELRDSPTYWVAPAGGGTPHPRPVWGVWRDHRLFLSVGSAVIARLLAGGPPAVPVSVHLDSGTDVVIVEGVVDGTDVDPAVVSAYEAKYDWTYAVDDYGPLTVIAPRVVMAWRSAGWAGRDGFRSAGRWRNPSTSA